MLLITAKDFLDIPRRRSRSRRVFFVELKAPFTRGARSPFIRFDSSYMQTKDGID
jgi:hypothetical protein